MAEVGVDEVVSLFGVRLVDAHNALSPHSRVLSCCELGVVLLDGMSRSVFEDGKALSQKVAGNPAKPPNESHVADAFVLCCRCCGSGGAFSCLRSSRLPGAALAAAQHGQFDQ